MYRLRGGLLNLIKLLQTGIICNFLLQLHGLFFLSLGHQCTDLLGCLFLIGTDFIRFLLCLTCDCIIFNDLIDQRKLIILEFLADVLFYCLRIFSQKLNINHFFLLLPPHADLHAAIIA